MRDSDIKNLPLGEHKILNETGLYVRIIPNGGSYYIRFKLKGRKASRMGLGSISNTTLPEAKRKAREAIGKVSAGIDPRAKGLTSGSTFLEVSEKLIDFKKPSWKTPTMESEWRSNLKLHCPALLDVDINVIETADVVAALNKIWVDKPTAAKKTAARIRTVFDFALAYGIRKGDNPAQWSKLKFILPEVKHKTEHFKAMPVHKLPAFCSEVKKLADGGNVAASCLLFTILTGVRSNESMGLERGEIMTPVWHLPAKKTKTAAPIDIPLSDQAIEALPPQRHASHTYYFARQGNKKIAVNAMINVVKRLTGEAYTVHGFRSCLKQWLTDQGYDWRVSEACLNHVVLSATEQAYFRGGFYKERSRALQAWADFVLPD